MSRETVAKVHGENATYEVMMVKGALSNSYKLYRNDKYEGTYSSRADAVRKAHEKAGPGAYES